jgi:hypothetical protein
MNGRSRGARASASKETTNSGRCRPWEERFELIKAYKEEHGHCVVPCRAEYRGFKLGRWVTEQRQRGKSGQLRKDRVAELNGIGFAWMAGESPRPWDETFELLKAYKGEHGHCRVPTSTEYRGVKLGSWVATQRAAHKKGNLGEDRVARLDGIGFTWVVVENLRSWDESFELLKAYKEEHGHCRVPQSAEYRGVKLGGWVSRQRTAHKAGKLSEAERTRLDDIGFCWSSKRGRSPSTESSALAQRTKRTRTSQ